MMDTSSDFAPGYSIDLLKALHILTRDGKLNQDSRRKLKQVDHLCRFIAPLLEQAFADHADPVLVDHGAGKSYLGFMLYDLFLKTRDGGRIIGVDSRAELVQASRRLADKLGFQRMRFHDFTVEAAISAQAIPDRIDIVTALHACDTATDDAISASRWPARPRPSSLSPVARPKLPPPCARKNPARSPHRRSPNSGATRYIPANSARKSPTSCAACCSKRTATK
jgi:hypothetical protein